MFITVQDYFYIRFKQVSMQISNTQNIRTVYMLFKRLNRLIHMQKEISLILFGNVIGSFELCYLQR